MTDPTDETQPHATATPPDPATAATPPAPPPDPAFTPAAAPSPDPAIPAATGSVSVPPGEPPLQVDPNRPADSGWREPAWFPPRDGERDRKPSPAAIVVGLAFIAVGVWFFLDRTLDVDLPRLQWSTIWPVILIVIGGLVLIRSFQRKA
jgi:hypothetical protein